jgi:hypothetical protein
MIIMEPRDSEPRTTDRLQARSQDTGQDGHGLLLSRDLIFTTKINQTAAALGHQIMVASNAATARSLIERTRPRVVFVDLEAGEMASAPAVSLYRALAGADAWFIAFGPHVEADALAAARAAGCQVVLPRSKFAAELPGLIKRYFSEPPG